MALSSHVDDSGSHIVATSDLGQDAVVVECSFKLVITKAFAKQAVLHILQGDPTSHVHQLWTERQWICTYIALHWILGPEEKRQEMHATHSCGFR